MSNNKAKFVTFEGGEGVGKSTQIVLFSEFLSSKGIENIVTREPGGTYGAEFLRSAFLSGEYEWDVVSELMLVMAARRDHMVHKILPTLDSGVWVLCDRFIDSSVVYQGVLRGMPEQWVVDMHRVAGMYLEPDLTIILSVSAKVAMQRKFECAREKLNRFDSMSEEKHETVCAAYKKICTNNQHRCAFIDGFGSALDVAELVVSAANLLLTLK
ncbi:dTMP kinase [Candidatus Hydrogenosomobacter endosymbioticus]|uniref:Thymidylate kinase n=1 Tax=Candidatus Hydrogenosomobacter endosymbioticus TaxID=2558174 RepID=A0ABM7V8I7_9PROT|nr:dTMP kinase [Candidatus Hydrogenosomobacter endosymbioticus]BDB96089.1 thymidylate kinase [Candidatus Hydrogenosomobacter endosymbioticus]